MDAALPLELPGVRGPPAVATDQVCLLHSEETAGFKRLPETGSGCSKKPLVQACGVHSGGRPGEGSVPLCDQRARPNCPESSQDRLRAQTSEHGRGERLSFLGALLGFDLLTQGGGGH